MVGDKSGPLGGSLLPEASFPWYSVGGEKRPLLAGNPTWGGGAVLPPTNPNLTLSPITTTTTTTIQTSLKHVS